MPPKRSRPRRQANPFEMKRMPADMMRANNQMVQTTTGVVIGVGALALGAGVVGSLMQGFHP